MSLTLTLTPVTPRRVKNAVSHGIFTTHGLARLIRLSLISGPWLLLTSRLSKKNASLMMLLCAPALLLFALLTLPTLIFQSPQQQAYYYFAQILNHDSVNWGILALMGLCTMTALAIPAMVPRPVTAIRY